MVFVTISDENDIITSLEIHEDTEISTLINIIESDFKINMNLNDIFYEGNKLNKIDTIKKLNIKSGDLLFVKKKINNEINNNNNNNLNINNLNNNFLKNINFNTPEWRNFLTKYQEYEEKEMIMREANNLLNLKDNKNRMDVIYIQNRELYNAINNNNLEKVQQILKEKYEQEKKEKEKEQIMYQNALKNPLSEDSQKFICENIYKEQINSNLALAQEHFPESFCNVFMLYIPVEINKTVVHAFIDSGAQTSIMSKKCAEKCNILRLIDKRFTGIAKGVGTKNILGKIHMVDIKIGNKFFAISLTILDENDIDFIFGLDLLKRHQCCIDLKQNALIIDNEKISFLHEKDV